jgi:CubicO group peptidase (beta-lactamase class C family)
MSVSKSYTSAAVGIAIEQGYINSSQDSIWDYLPDHQQFATEGNEDIIIEHLLSITSGPDCKDWGTSYGDPENDAIGLWFY